MTRFGMRTVLAAALALVTTTATTATADQAAVWKRGVAGWNILVDRSIGDGCFMTTTYRNGTALRVQFNPRKDMVQMIVGHADWRSIAKGQSYDMAVRFGGRPSWTGAARGLRLGTLPAIIMDVPFERERAKRFIAEFRSMPEVRVFFRGGTIAHLSLTGAGPALTELYACQAAMLGRSTDPFSGVVSGVNDPFR